MILSLDGVIEKGEIADQLTGFCTLLNVHYELFLALF
jgi:hypothetical protein